MSDQSGWLYLCPARLHFFLLLRCTCGLVMLKSAKSVAVMSRSPKARTGSGLYGFHLELKSIGTVHAGSTSFIDFQNSNCTNRPISSSFGRFIAELLMVFSSNDTVTFFRIRRVLFIHTIIIFYFYVCSLSLNELDSWSIGREVHANEIIWIASLLARSTAVIFLKRRV